MTAEVKTTHPFARALSNRNFRLLWVGGSVSVLGSQFSLIALPWLVLQPALPLRFLDFWLATVTLALACLGWIVTTPAELRA